MSLESHRKTHFKPTLKYETAFEDRKRAADANRLELKQAIVQRHRACASQALRQRQEHGVTVTGTATATATPGVPDMAAKLTEMKLYLQSTEVVPEAAFLELCKAVFVDVPASGLESSCITPYLHVTQLLARRAGGSAVVSIMPLLSMALQCGDSEIVSDAAMVFVMGLDNDADDCLRDEMWSHGTDPIGAIMSIVMTEAPELQSMLVLCLCRAIGGGGVERVVRLVPLLCAMVGTRDDTGMLSVMALQCTEEIACKATLEVLTLIRDSGLLSLCITLIGEADTSKRVSIAHALNIVDAFAQFLDGTDIPSTWIVVDGILPALEGLTNTVWADVLFARTIARITCNVAVSVFPAVLGCMGLCESIAEYALDEELEVAVHEEASHFFAVVVQMNGTNAEVAQALVDRCEVLVIIKDALCKLNMYVRKEMLKALNMLLETNPAYAEDFAECGGVSALMRSAMQTENMAVQTLCYAILTNHFPIVLES
jgi:hypothetical protein